MKRYVEWIVVVLILTILGMGCPQELNDLLPEDTGSLSLVQLQYIGTATRTALVEALASFRVEGDIPGMSGTYTDDEHIDIQFSGCDVGAIGVLESSSFEPGEITITDGTYLVYLSDGTLFKNLALTVEFGEDSAIDGEHGVILEIRVYDYDTVDQDEQIIKFTVDSVNIL